MTSPGAYAFRPLALTDLPLLRAWLGRPHVQPWWPDPDGDVAEIGAHLDRPTFHPYLVLLDGRPIAYLQTYDVAAESGGVLGDHPAGTLGVDLTIGEPDLVGIGHGSAMLRAFADHLAAAGVPRLVIDPNPDNRRAVRCYAKAGFVPERLVETPDGPALLMVRTLPSQPAGRLTP